MDLVEQLGSGIPRILKTYGETCFYFSENFTRMSFPIDKEFQKNITDKVTKNVTKNVTENRAKEILKLIKINNKINTEEMAISLNVTKRTILRDIEKLKQQNIIIYTGSAKRGYWVVVTIEE